MWMMLLEIKDLMPLHWSVMPGLKQMLHLDDKVLCKNTYENFVENIHVELQIQNMKHV